MSDEKRAYNAQSYWEQRYQHRLNKRSAGAAGAADATDAPDAANKRQKTDSASAAADADNKQSAKPKSKSKSKSKSGGAGASADESGGEAMNRVAAVMGSGGGGGREIYDDTTLEWYYSYRDLKPLIDTAIKTHRNNNKAAVSLIVDIGCGVSSLFPELTADGYTNARCVGIDYSPAVCVVPTPHPHSALPFPNSLCL